MVIKSNSAMSLYKSRSLKRILFVSPFLILLSWLSLREIQAFTTKPQIIFVLGGNVVREVAGAQLAKANPDLPIWVSSGSPSNYLTGIFQHAGVNIDRLNLDYQAKDTLTNFTTLADDFKTKKIKNVYLVTSTAHMRRAYLIGEIVFGSRGIVMRPFFVQTNERSESWKKSIRDVFRAFLWLSTGKTISK